VPGASICDKLITKSKHISRKLGTDQALVRLLMYNFPARVGIKEKWSRAMMAPVAEQHPDARTAEPHCRYATINRRCIRGTCNNHMWRFPAPAGHRPGRSAGACPATNGGGQPRTPNGRTRARIYIYIYIYIYINIYIYRLITWMRPTEYASTYVDDTQTQYTSTYTDTNIWI
jgi:hypothetical protein